MDEKLNYVMTRLNFLEKDLQIYLNLPGRKKSYLGKCEECLTILASIRHEIELWNNYGLSPDILPK